MLLRGEELLFVVCVVDPALVVPVPLPEDEDPPETEARVEETTADVALTDTVAVPSSTVK